MYLTIQGVHLAIRYLRPLPTEPPPTPFVLPSPRRLRMELAEVIDAEPQDATITFFDHHGGEWIERSVYLPVGLNRTTGQYDIILLSEAK